MQLVSNVQEELEKAKGGAKQPASSAPVISATNLLTGKAGSGAEGLVTNEVLLQKLCLPFGRIVVDIKEIVSFCVDLIALRQVLLNLVLNANKYSDPGTDIHVTSWVSKDRNFVVFSVRDVGPGIPPDMQHRLFTRHGNKLSTAKHRKSTGIGLFASRQVVEQRLKGAVWLNADYMEGCEFRVSVPLS